MQVRTTKIIMKSTTDDAREFKGDGLRVRLENNELQLKVSGDGCRVNVSRNSGRIRVHGDGCYLNVDSNSGDIEYKGDGGQIVLGPGSRMENVNYVGCGGKISCAGKTVSGRRSSGKKRNPEEKSASDPELDNAINERKEANASATRNEMKKRLQRRKTIVGSKIHPEISVNVDGNVVRHWFRSFPPVDRSFESGSETL